MGYEITCQRRRMGSGRSDLSKLALILGVDEAFENTKIAQGPFSARVIKDFLQKRCAHIQGKVKSTQRCTLAHTEK